jgi:hypothetical protein
MEVVDMRPQSKGVVPKRHPVPVIACIASLLLLVACDDFTPGPELQVEVLEASLGLEATTGDDSLCCCLVTGRAINMSTVAVHVTLKFEAFAAGEEEPFGTAIDFMRDLAPGEERQIIAPGLFVPCSEIDRIELVDVDLRGIWP